MRALRFSAYGSISSASPATQVAMTRTASGSSATKSARYPGAMRPNRSRQAEKRRRGAEARRSASGRLIPSRRTQLRTASSHVERRAGEHAVGGRDAAVTQDDVLAAEPECASGTADRRHRVGDEHRVAHAAQRQTQHRRRDMLAIDDQPIERARLFERRRDRSGIARRERPHRVEQMGEAGQPLGEGRAGLFIGRHRMAERDPHPCPRQRRDKARRHAFRRQRHHRRAAARHRQQRQIGVVGHAEHRRSCTPARSGDRNGPSK